MVTKIKCIFSLFLVLTVVVLFTVNNYAEGAWKTKTVDAFKEFSRFYPRSLAIDTSNHPHIVYGGDHLYHAYYNGTKWIKETVDPSSLVGQYASVAIDHEGKVHITYYDYLNSSLKYATNASGSWVKKTVDLSANGDVGRYSSIALDGTGKVHISYFAGFPDYDLRYANNTSGSWVTETVDQDGDVGQYTSLAVDDGGKVHISYSK